MRAWTRSFGIVAFAGALFFAAGCGGDEGPGPDSADPAKVSGAPATNAGNGVPTTALDAEKRAAEAKQKLTECMRKQGMKGLPSPGASLSPQEREAAQKCAAQMFMSSDSGLQSKIEALRTCMKEKGAPVPAAGEPFLPKTDDPKVAAAMKACQKSGSG
ncbi:hypothetical protein [Spirillospora sp. NPDC047279]|uniref:hypothetical protein n=1 Tax=Spirillospora sp. NPDC047279 TaxID=3155478 RepID=UPI0033F4706F